MLASIVCAWLQGARGYVAISEWIHDQEVALWHTLGFTRRPPKKTAFRNLLLALAPEDFEQAVRNWIQACLGSPPEDGPLAPVAMDGKTLRGTLRSHERAIHLLSLLDQQTGCVLSQTRVDEKTNEAKAALELLKSLVLKGRVITGDAMFCQREVCQQILDEGGHYFFVVKDNQPTLKAAIAAEFQAAFSPGERTTAGIASGSGRDGWQGARSPGASASTGQHASVRPLRRARFGTSLSPRADDFPRRGRTHRNRVRRDERLATAGRSIHAPLLVARSLGYRESGALGSRRHAGRRCLPDSQR
jgi:hypothetical protein